MEKKRTAVSLLKTTAVNQTDPCASFSAYIQVYFQTLRSALHTERGLNITQSSQRVDLMILE